jgi:hypothetical protein
MHNGHAKYLNTIDRDNWGEIQKWLLRQKHIYRSPSFIMGLDTRYFSSLQALQYYECRDDTKDEGFYQEYPVVGNNF